MKLPEGFQEIFDRVSDGVYFVDTERKILYWNKQAEEIAGYKRKEIINSHCYDNILRHMDDEGRELCKDKCPLVYAIENNKYIEKRVYLHHKNGQRVPVFVRVLPLKDEENRIIGAIEIFNEAIEFTNLKKELEKLRELTYIDELTGVLNRRGLNFFLRKQINNFKKNKKAFGVLFMDIDNFKEINDRYGHNVGDKVLKMLSETLKNNLRTEDMVARYGGDEFVVILQVGDINTLESLTKRIKNLIENSFLEEAGRIIKITVSVGGTLIRENDTMNTLLKRADELMYQSKKEGKNLYKISL
ncbi:GGDEF domain-containing protein [Dictyoglomus thermophilum]|uniref:Sensory box/ggdef family protein n=1 Tax=Dictyoglomus thermophilum (strain ATCC 35947 / DSM 3960 / H-6-12) TaxID=309799 RepID=B5YCM7_DICT6|nr:GGDEF domain-containing protein [Dictyoglomus thermophilum]ACI20121.1 sensory box/ggdef family protein [Dictyoglomus thermophilum H-6-12]